MKFLFEKLKANKAKAALIAKSGSFAVEDSFGVALLVAAAFKEKQEAYTIVANNLYHAQKIYDFLSSFIGEENCLFFPVDEVLRLDAVSASKEMLAQRLYVMHELCKKETKVLVTHVAGVIRYLPKEELFKEKTITFKVGDVFSFKEIKEKLIAIGYEKVNKIDQSLQFAVRGDILDIYSVNEEQPVRIEFFDDEIENIRYFDIATQRSLETLLEITILPASDMLFTKKEYESIEGIIKEKLAKDLLVLPNKERLEVKVDNDLNLFRMNKITASLYSYYGILKEEYNSILDYANHSTIILVDKKRILNTANQMLQEETDFFLEGHEQSNILTGLSLYQNIEGILMRFKKTIYMNPLLEKESDIAFWVRPILSSSNTFKDALQLIKYYLETDNKIIISLSSEQQKKAISDMLNDSNIEYSLISNNQMPKDKLSIMIQPFQSGFELVEEKIVILSSNELFGYRIHQSRFLNRYKEAVILKSYEELEPGDYIVHEQNGIGKFIGIKTLEVNGLHRDYLQIAYAGSDVLYVPLEQFKLVRKFVGKDGVTPKINKLGSTEWEKTKRRIKDKVNDMADRLIKLYAERESTPGFAFKEDDEFQISFESQFPFELTKDQETALKEIKEDMEKPTPMDRLLCGDVGFGKTEVAFRAAFKAMLSGKQVGLLCPTTLLARQHYERAMERFAFFGIKIVVLSRLIPQSIQKSYIEKIKDGSVNLIIGTHRLLSKEIEFSDLGLLIIDEEQRFGVEQKERIKEMKQNIDVLTLTATPIPRTLQMSLVGMRKYSQLNTAPMNRLPIQTYVVPHNDEMVQELIERELARQGQVFYLHNRVSSIYSVARKIQQMVPDAKIGVAHGKMEHEDIEDIMIKFYSGEINVLVCTSIIETGIDIENVNMIIVENADHFGLAQLYQIKGRVGRGGRIAYAYLLYNSNKEITETAKKRLKAIQDFTELGSGYRIAQRDLMIRGAGDILGSEQAGFIDTVGIDMYMKLLQEVIEEKQKGTEESIAKEESKRNISIDAYIPSVYASDGDKIELYQQIDNAKTCDELANIAEEIQDIYGRIPVEVSNLLQKKRIELLLTDDVFEDMLEKQESINLYLNKEFSSINGIGIKLFQALTAYLSYIKVTYTNKKIMILFSKKGDWIENFCSILTKINELNKSLQ